MRSNVCYQRGLPRLVVSYFIPGPSLPGPTVLTQSSSLPAALHTPASVAQFGGFSAGRATNREAAAVRVGKEGNSSVGGDFLGSGFLLA